MKVRHARAAVKAGTLAACGLLGGMAFAQTLSVDHDQVRRWNRFADSLLSLHHQQLAAREVVRSESDGGYATHPDFYREHRFQDAATGRLLSIVRWEKARPDVLHNIEVYQYDGEGRVVRDYLAAYLPDHRNAPIQTLVNVHGYRDQLHAFRQFDASGVRIYEQCRGQWMGDPVMVSLDEDELPINRGAPPPEVGDALYTTCFEGLPTEVDMHLAQLLAVPTARDDGEREAVEFRIDLLTELLAATPQDANLHLERGRRYFQLNDFTRAVSDLDRALALNAGLDDAWFWRGMARGRAGDVRGAVADLDVYIERHPDDAYAYTKRGVRYIWLGDLDRARLDLEKALALDPTNAEAHDDLGVVHAQQQRYEVARHHFRQAIDHDPGYQKAHHNLAMMHYLAGDHGAALDRVERALDLEPESRNGLLLKAAILQAQGREAEALAITERAEFLPEGDWSERLPVR